MGVGIVVTVAEHADALVEHQFRIRLVGLPLSRLLPGNATVSHSPMETCLAGSVGSMSGCFGIAHVVERVSNLMSHAVSHGFTSRGIEPECRHLVVVATSVASPLLRVVHEHHYLILRKVRRLRVYKAQRVEFQVEERLALRQQVVDIDIVETRCLRGRLVTIVFIPEHDDVVGLLRARLRPRVLVVRIALGIEQRVGALLTPLLRNVDLLLSKRGQRTHCQNT